MDDAIVGLWGVVVGAVISLVGTVVVPWIRDKQDRQRAEREELERGRRDSLLSAIAALLEMGSFEPGEPGNRAAQARFGRHFNDFIVRVGPDEQDVVAVLNLMLVMVQKIRRDGAIERMFGETMGVLTLWARGDVATEAVVSEVEQRAKVKLSADRKIATPIS